MALSLSGTNGVDTPAITNSGTDGVGNIGNSTTGFNTVFAKSTSAQYADLAEKYLSDSDYEPGTVVSFGGSSEVTLSAVDADTRVAGVVSTEPAFLMNTGLKMDAVNLALAGRVPCKVTGNVNPGDMMVSNGDGTARAEFNPPIGSVIGKALQSFSGETGTIEVVVGRY
jgi:hypothetical protein